MATPFESAAAPSILGVNVYGDSLAWQNRFLVKGLAPALARTERPGRAPALWFERYDARGPHLCILLRSVEGPPQHRTEDQTDLREALEEELARYLRSHPPPEAVDAAELEERHTVCAKRPLCSLDAEPGMVPAGTQLWFRQPVNGYPYHLTLDHPYEENVWRLLDRQVRWTLQWLPARAPGSAQGVACRWLMALAAALEGRWDHPEPFWRYYARSLLPALEQRLAEDEAETLASLPSWVGDGNRRVFDALWQQRHEPNFSRQGLAELVACLLPDPAAASDRLRLLREVAYGTLKQLGVMAAFQVPMVLDLWSRHARTIVPA